MNQVILCRLRRHMRLQTDRKVLCFLASSWSATLFHTCQTASQLQMDPSSKTQDRVGILELGSPVCGGNGDSNSL